MRIAPARPSAQWAQEFVPSATDYQRWDAKQAKVVNATDGGVWAPANPVRIGGEGMTVHSGSLVTGGLTIDRGAVIQHGAQDVVSFGNVRQRTIVLPMTEMMIDPTLVIPANTRGGTSYELELEDYIAVQLAPASGIVPSGTTELQLSIPSRYLHHVLESSIGGPNAGSPALSNIALTFRILSRPMTIAAETISMTILGWSETGGGANPVSPAPTTWAASTAYTVGHYVVPNALANPLSYFKCAVAGTSGTSAPSWNTTPGSNTLDPSPSGPLSWECIGGRGLLYAASPDAYYAGGQSQTLSVAFDPMLSAGADVLDCQLYRYGVILAGLPTDGSILLESLSFSFVNITSAAFE